MSEHDVELLETPHLLTVEEYMSLESEARTELLRGLIYDVSPRNQPHRYAVSKLNQALARALPAGLIVSCQDAVAVNGWKGRDAPEIDIAVLADKTYRLVPTAADAVAFVEVSDATYALDRGYKIPLYVAAGVASFIVNIWLRQVECYRSATDLAAEHGHVIPENGTADIAGVAIRVAALFAE